MSDKAKGTNRGQQKSHEVVYPDGTTGTMTQEEWRNRDKSLGIQRVDEAEEAEAPAPAEPAPENPA